MYHPISCNLSILIHSTYSIARPIWVGPMSAKDCKVSVGPLVPTRTLATLILIGALMVSMPSNASNKSSLFLFHHFSTLLFLCYYFRSALKISLSASILFDLFFSLFSFPFIFSLSQFCVSVIRSALFCYIHLSHVFLPHTLSLCRLFFFFLFSPTHMLVITFFFFIFHCYYRFLRCPLLSVFSFLFHCDCFSFPLITSPKNRLLF